MPSPPLNKTQSWVSIRNIEYINVHGKHVASLVGQEAKEEHVFVKAKELPKHFTSY